MRLALTTWQLWVMGAGGALIAASGVVYLWRRRPRDPNEEERARRAYLNRVGRIVEGHVVELLEMPADTAPTSRMRLGRRKETAPVTPDGKNTLIAYTYSISGVTYEAAQDVTNFKNRVVISHVMNGQQASVKYDPGNPSNSILFADDWSGLR